MMDLNKLRFGTYNSNVDFFNGNIDECTNMEHRPIPIRNPELHELPSNWKRVGISRILEL